MPRGGTLGYSRRSGTSWATDTASRGSLHAACDRDTVNRHCMSTGVARAFARGVRYACHAICPLVDFTHDNGATRVVPGSHRKPWMLKGRFDPLKPHPAERQLVGAAGTVFVLNIHFAHSAVLNASREPRLAVFANFSAGTRPCCRSIRSQTRAPRRWHAMTPRLGDPHRPTPPGPSPRPAVRRLNSDFFSANDFASAGDF